MSKVLWAYDMDSRRHSTHPPELDEMLRAYAAWEAAADALFAKVVAGQVLNTLHLDQFDQDYALSQALHRDWIKTVGWAVEQGPRKPDAG